QKKRFFCHSPLPVTTAFLISVNLSLPQTLPPLQGEGRGGDGAKPAPEAPHPPPVLPLEGGGTFESSPVLWTVRKAAKTSSTEGLSWQRRGRRTPENSRLKR